MLVDAVLAEAGGVQQRLRDLHRRVGSVPVSVLFGLIAGPLAGTRGLLGAALTRFFLASLAVIAMASSN